MITELILGFFLVATAPLQIYTKIPKMPLDTTVFLELERVWIQAHLSGDTVTLASLCDDRFVLQTPIVHRTTKKDMLAAWRDSSYRYLRYETTGLRMIRRVPDQVSVGGQVYRKRQVGGRVFEERWRFSKAYVRVGKQWKLVVWSATESGG